MISLSQRPLPDNTQQSQTDSHAPGGIRTHDLNRRAAADLRLRPRGQWDRLQISFNIGLISRELWTHISLYLITCDFCVCEMLKEDMNSNNPRTESDNKVNVQNKAFSVSPAELRRAANQISVRCEAFLRAEGNNIKRFFF